jgi:hypothetical protein
MHLEDEINQWLPPASGNDDGPNKMPAANQGAKHQSTFLWGKMSHDSLGMI